VKRSFAFFLTFLIAIVSFAGSASAQRGEKGAGDPESSAPGGLHAPNPASKYKNLFFGTVKEVNNDGLVLTKTQAGVDQSFKFNKKTKFLVDGKEASLTSVHLGDSVWVDVDKNKRTGELIARKVMGGVVLLPSY
jgi:hypothetical protein